jgi:hypothetical protein
VGAYPKGCTEGAGKLSPGFTLGYPNRRFALKGLEMHRRSISEIRSRILADLVAPSGLMRLGEFPRVNPGLSFFGHFGPQIRNVQITAMLRGTEL